MKIKTAKDEKLLRLRNKIDKELDKRKAGKRDVIEFILQPNVEVETFRTDVIDKVEGVFTLKPKPYGFEIKGLIH